MIDTNIAIFVRDGHEAISARVGALPFAPFLSVLSRVELEGGIYADPARAAARRARVDRMLEIVDEVPFTTREAAVYGRIVQTCGYSRPRVIDRMIAAQAIVAGSALATLNARDFSDIPDLRVEDWAT